MERHYVNTKASSLKQTCAGSVVGCFVSGSYSSLCAAADDRVVRVGIACCCCRLAGCCGVGEAVSSFRFIATARCCCCCCAILCDWGVRRGGCRKSNNSYKISCKVIQLQINRHSLATPFFLTALFSFFFFLNNLGLFLDWKQVLVGSNLRSWQNCYCGKWYLRRQVECGLLGVIG